MILALLAAAGAAASVPIARPGNSAAMAVPVQGVSGGTPIPISGSISTSGTADVVSTGAPTTFGANSVCTGSLLLAGEQGAGFQLNAGTLSATLTPQYSMEASGTNWTNTQFIDQNGTKTSTLVVTNPNALFQQGIVLVTGARRVQVCTTAYTSGSATGFADAAFVQGGAASGGGGGSVTQGTSPWIVAGGGTAGTAATGVVTVQGIASMTAVKVDGSAVTQPVSGTFWPTLANSPLSARLSDGTSFYNTVAAAQLPAALDGSGFLKVHEQGTATVSGTVTANIGTTNGLALDATVAKLNNAQGSTTSGQTGPLIQGAVTTAAPTYTTAQTSPISLTTAGAVRVDGSGVTQPVSGTTTANQGTAAALASGWPVKVTDGTNTQPTGDTIARAIQVDVSDGTTGIVVKAASTAPATTDPAVVVTQSPNPAEQCPNKVAINQTTSTQIITGTASKKTHICSIVLVSGGAQNISLVEGTGTVCATSIAAIIGGTTASVALAANGGFVSTSDKPWLVNATAANNICLLQSAASNVSGVITYGVQ